MRGPVISPETGVTGRRHQVNVLAVQYSIEPMFDLLQSFQDSFHPGNGRWPVCFACGSKILHCKNSLI